MHKHWNKFYTPLNTATKIIDLIPSRTHIKKVADICAGSGNLLDAAYKRWPTSNYLAIDIDSRVLFLPKNRHYKITTRCQDATDFQGLSSYFNRSRNFTGGCDLVVANPPFGYFRLKVDKDLISSLSYPLDILYKEALNLGRIEALMLISNILSLKIGGTFAAVLPESLFTSERWCNFRDIILNDCFEIVHVGKTQQVFKGSDVRTRNFVAVRKKGSTGKFVNIKDYGIKSKIRVVRGTALSSIKSKKGAYSVFHTDSFNAMRKSMDLPSRIMINKKDSKFNKEAILKRDDVVVVRVSKNAGAAEVVKDNYVGWHISDCVLIVRNSQYTAKHLAKKLNRVLTTVRKGLAAQYITKNDIMEALI